MSKSEREIILEALNRTELFYHGSPTIKRVQGLRDILINQGVDAFNEAFDSRLSRLDYLLERYTNPQPASVERKARKVRSMYLLILYHLNGLI